MTRNLRRSPRDPAAPTSKREQLLERRLRELQISLVELQDAFTNVQLRALGSNDLQAAHVLEALRGDLAAPYGKALSAATSLAGVIRWDTEKASGD